MKVDKKQDTLIFSTGKRVYANCCIVGINEPEEDDWEIYEGYDGILDVSWTGRRYEYEENPWKKVGTDRLTPSEKVELADYMINLWKKFRTDQLELLMQFKLEDL